ncbi:MFS transporter, DHA1 family, purine base/nucleoside efflux pump [Marinococcus luteus]|uniref:MFS transporter, DHA1 family, purine base/nucleoside efflux pump n=1 Tax=Marinococcus luteus TaxID=1122204 RepID=A0A1H2TFJ7_9BACI|nr:MFS transporter [Marinococcus luteus]SDW42610.1 MFS transporter, DHA1 family, purine base/nucleoside efflux pump [Marinococcus luteus]
MNSRVYLLAVSAFIVGMVELIISGILPLISEDLGVSIAIAGQLITIFALVFAVAGPLLLSFTSNVERKTVYMWALAVFAIANVGASFAPTFAVLMAARFVTAASAALIIVLALTMAPKLVEAKYRSRSIGLVTMGVSSALVLGVPLGVLIGDAFGWRIIFVMIAVLTVFIGALMVRFLPRMQPEQVVTVGQQIRSLKDIKIVGIHSVTLLVLAGHYTLYGYFNPFMQETMGLNSFWISAMFFIFGAAAVSGGGVGGWLTDQFGSKKMSLTFIASFAVILFILPFATNSMALFIIAVIIWGILSWSIAPAQQSYLIAVAPETSDIQQSVNTSALQVGIAIGSILGGIVVEQSVVAATSWAGSALVVVAMAIALMAYRSPRVRGSEPTKS